MSPATTHFWLKKVSPEELYWKGEKGGREGRRGRGRVEQKSSNCWVKLTRALPEELWQESLKHAWHTHFRNSHPSLLYQHLYCFSYKNDIFASENTLLLDAKNLIRYLCKFLHYFPDNKLQVAPPKRFLQMED